MLSKLQTRLATHFTQLRDARSGTGNPVFALEHPLAPEEIAPARQQTSAAGIAARSLTDDHWLVWIVIAAELGYTFSGDEYWQSFTTAIDGWTTFGKRERLRDWYSRFAATYGGLRPSGRWAEHRTIISWPITHAILPNDLQSAFMREFHALSPTLAEFHHLSAEELGALFAAKSQTSSSRLRSFLEQTSIVGRLVLALGNADVLELTPPIAPQTLKRIVKDLERDEARRVRLAEARRTFREARLRVSAQLTAAPIRATPPGASLRRNSPDIGSPQLIAYRSPSGDWSLSVSLPTMQDAVLAEPQLAAWLTKSAVRFFDSRERPRPARLLLQSHLECPIVQLPAHDSVLAELDADLPQPWGRLASAYRFPSGDQWLLRIQADGSARQVVGAYVRPAQKYLLVRRQPLPAMAALAAALQPATSATADAHIYELAVPATLHRLQLAELDKIGVGYRLAISVEPVGLVPRRPAEHGDSEWLTTEEVILSLNADHEVREYSLSLDDASMPCRIPIHTPGPILVSLGRLAPGYHVLSVAARVALGDRAQPLQATVRLHVHPPGFGEAAKEGQVGISADLVPVNARLEELLTGRARMVLFGPQSREVLVSCSCLLSKHLVPQELDLGRVHLPVTPDRLTQLFRTKEETLLAAGTATFTFDCGDLGRARIQVQHDTDPLRWICQREKGNSTVALIDESDDPTVKFRQASIAEPDRFTTIATDPRNQPIPVPSPGALYCASLKGRQYALFVSTPHEGNVRHFEDLRLVVALNPNKQSRPYFTSYLGVLRLWSRTRVVGKLGLLRREQVIDAVRIRLLSIACGDHWADDLTKIKHAPVLARDLERLQRGIGGSPGFGSRIRHAAWDADPRNQSGNVQQMLDAAAFYDVCKDKRVVAAAITFAFNPAALRMKRDDPFAAELLNYRTLLRGAAFAAALATVAATPQLKIA
jgi:hypothetical protein